jgi:hypothetical protein
MKLYLLRPIDDHPAWEPWCDKAFGFVARATDEAHARRLAQAKGGDETGYKDAVPAWTDPSMSTCVELTVEGEAGVIIQDFARA